MKARILLVEDEPHLSFQLKLNLEAEGYEVVCADDGLKGEAAFFLEGPFDLAILDVMLPEKSGIEIAKVLRLADSHVGVLMLTALASSDDRVKGLETGADDYVTKPFSLTEFLLRVKRMLERTHMLKQSSTTSKSFLSFGSGMKLYVSEGYVTTSKGNQQLTKLEAHMLAELINRSGEVLTREYLLEKVWGVSIKIESRTVDNFIARLRKIIEDDVNNPRYIKSVRGFGYKFDKE